MNNQRRKKLEKILEALAELQGQIEEIASEERSAFEALEDRGLGETEKAEVIEENASSLEGLDSTFEEISDVINEVISK